MPRQVLQAWNASYRGHAAPLDSGEAGGSTGLPLRAIAWASLALLACPQQSGGASTKRDPAPVSAQPPPGQVVPPVEEGRVIDLTGGGGASGSPSELHPLEGADGCVEMYTVCIPEGQSEKCTSARFELSCGEEGKIPSTGEHVRCVCP
jgi:hypothetical protein